MMTKQVSSSEFDMTRRKLLQMAGMVGLSVAAGPLLAACGATTTQPAPTPTGGGAAAAPGTAAATAAAKFKTGPVVCQVHTLENEYFVNYAKGVEEAIKALEGEFRTLLHAGDTQKQVGQVDQVAVTGVKMLVGNVATEGVLPAVAKAAQQNQIYYSNTWDIPAWFTPLDVGDYYVQFQCPDGIKQGYESAKVLFEAIGGNGTVVHISGFPGASADTARTAGLMKAAKEFPGIKVVGGQPANWNRIDAIKVMEDTLTRYPKIEGVFAQNDDAAIGAIQVLKNHKIKVPVVSVNGDAEGLKAIIAGDMIATHSNYPGYQGGYSVVQVFDALNGVKFSVPDRMIFTGTTLVTKKNAQQMLDAQYGSKLPFDWRKMSRFLNPKDWDPQLEIVPIVPDEYWKGAAGQEKLNPAYAKAKAAGEFEAVRKLYTDHYKSKV